MKRRFLLHMMALIGFLGAALVLPSPSAWAQDSLPKGFKEDKNYVPEEFVDEAMAFHDECAADYKMTQYYNCQCLSLAYLDKRIERGKIESPGSIKLAIRNECRDAIGSAGPVYQECLRKANSFEPGTDPEKYCECVANTYVKMTNLSGSTVSSRSIVPLKASSYLSCRNPQ